jgi:hypothetical protein
MGGKDFIIDCFYLMGKGINTSCAQAEKRIIEIGMLESEGIGCEIIFPGWIEL